MFKAKKIIKIFFALFLISGIIIWIVNGYISKEMMGGFNNSSPSEKIGALESMKDENNFLEIEEKEFTSPDGKIKFSYSSLWQEIEDESILAELVPGEVRQKYAAEIIFLAHRLEDQKYNQVIIANKAVVEREKEVIEIIKDMNKGEERTMEIIESTIEEEGNKIYFEALYTKENNPSLHSKEVSVILEKNEKEDYLYLVSFTTSEEGWEASKEKAENIIGSVRLVE
jgi:hypothetical protein